MALHDPLQTPRLFLLLGLIASAVTASSAAAAQSPPDEPHPAPPPPTAAPARAEPNPAAPPPTPSTPATPVTPATQSPASEKRTETLVPRPAEPAPTINGARMQADPIADGAVLGIAFGFAALSNMIIGTGEIRPQQISPTFDNSQLLGIDRGAITQHVDASAGLRSNIGLYAAMAYPIIDSIATGVRESSKQAALVDGIIYAESLALTAAVTNLAKIAVRRPRPAAYIDASAHKGDPNYSNDSTNSSLSFFSGHASTCAAVTGTATYLAFTRSPNSPRPWLTLIGGTMLTGFVGIERVRAGAHFPTDVIAGAVAGAGLGVLTAHLHREDTAKQRAVWIGFVPGIGDGGTVTLGGSL